MLIYRVTAMDRETTDRFCINYNKLFLNNFEQSKNCSCYNYLNFFKLTNFAIEMSKEIRCFFHYKIDSLFFVLKIKTYYLYT